MKRQVLSLARVGGVQKPGDVVVLSASYEERCLSVANTLDPALVEEVFVFENVNHKEIHQGNGEALLDRFPGNARLVEIRTDSPLVTADSIVGSLRKVAAAENVRMLVDMSTFTHEAFLILVRFLDLVRGLRNVVFLYVSASDYSVREAPESKWLSKGVGEVRSILGYPGQMLPSRPLHLIALVGLESERAVDLIARYDPSEISLGYGLAEEDIGMLASEASDRGFERVKALYRNAGRFEFPCFDPDGTRLAILAQVARFEKCNIVLAPMNTKISALGAGVLASRQGGFQLCYAQALVYNYLGYSSPGEKVVMVEY